MWLGLIWYYYIPTKMHAVEAGCLDSVGLLVFAPYLFFSRLLSCVSFHV